MIQLGKYFPTNHEDAVLAITASANATSEIHHEMIFFIFSPFAAQVLHCKIQAGFLFCYCPDFDSGQDLFNEQFDDLVYSFLRFCQ